MRRLMTCAVLMALGGSTAVFAQTEFTEKTVGDWRGVENAWQHAAELRRQEFSPWAGTNALDGREGSIGINSCGRYNVDFSLQAATVWFEGEASEDGIGIIYGKTLPAKTVMQPIMVTPGDMQYFSFDADMMVTASKLMLCPTKEENSDCLTFSLKGFTAALKMVCPKR